VTLPLSVVRPLVAAIAIASLAAPTPGPAPTFRNIAHAAGIDFVLQNHPTAEKHLIETVPGGVAAFDYNNDGRVDLFFANGAASPSLQKQSPADWNRLYRNDGVDAAGRVHFTDVTREAGMAGIGFAMGVAAADFDNDGFTDLFVAGVRENRLYRNTGNGTFEDVTARAGVENKGEWAVGGGWFDYDNDGLLDLFVVNYVRWTPDYSRYCGDEARQIRVYCHPRYFEGLANRLYRNRGDGTFEDVSERSGIGRSIGKGMSVAFADYDDDGHVDAFVTNDGVPNFLFHNRGDGTFEETALLAGVSVPMHGKPVSSMGVDFQDYDNDGRPDLAVTALASETFPLYRNEGRGVFSDATQASRLATLTRRMAGWSMGLFDLNNDGWKDIFAANAHVNDRVEAFEASTYRQANAVLLNLGAGAAAGGAQFRDATADAGPELQALKAAHRGAAFADFNGDGKIDIAVSALGAPAELWENTTATAGPGAGAAHWIILQLEGTKSNRSAIGARVTIGRQVRTVSTSVGYNSSSDVRAHFGLGVGADTAKIDRIEIKWPSGTVQVLDGLDVDRVVKVVEKRP
jgi:enediyne biosynthesis protein E4